MTTILDERSDYWPVTLQWASSGYFDETNLSRAQAATLDLQRSHGRNRRRVDE